MRGVEGVGEGGEVDVLFHVGQISVSHRQQILLLLEAEILGRHFVALGGQVGRRVARRVDVHVNLRKSPRH